MDKVFTPGSYFYTTIAAPASWEREGTLFIKSFDSPVEKLEVRRGRLTALVNGMWHIIDTTPRQGGGLPVIE